MSTNSKKTDKMLTFGLAMLGGTGLTVMMVSLSVGVIQGAGADSRAIGLGFALGLALLITGVAGWIAVVRPFTNFDDINIPKDIPHHEEHSEDAGHAAHDSHGTGHHA